MAVHRPFLYFDLYLHSAYAAHYIRIFLYSYEESKKRYLHVKTIRYIIFRVVKKNKKKKQQNNKKWKSRKIDQLLDELSEPFRKLEEASVGCGNVPKVHL